MNYTEFKEALKEGNYENIDFLQMPDDEDLGTIGYLSECCLLMALFFKNPEEVSDILEKFLPAFEGFIEEYVPEGIKLEEDKEEMAVEYVRLFVNSVGGVPAVPYLSYYTGDEKYICGDDHIKVKLLLESEGLEVDGDSKEIEDHISVIFELLYNLFNSMVVDVKEEDYNKLLSAVVLLTDTFFEEAVGKLADKIIEHSELAYYKNVGKLLKEFASEMDEIVKDVFYKKDI